jgi:hypothetical protein
MSGVPGTMDPNMRIASGGGEHFDNPQFDSSYHNNMSSQPNMDSHNDLNPPRKTNTNTHIDEELNQNVTNTEDRLNKPLPTRERTNANGTPKEKTSRLCKKCTLPLTGQFVRALDGTFHLDCFRCQVRIIPVH